MSHITKINGTNHNIDSGKVLRSGTSYNISFGKTLVGGTNKNINFNISVVINVTGTGNDEYCYFKLGNSIVSSSGTYAANIGDRLIFAISGASTSSSASTLVINGEEVLQVIGFTTKNYAYIIPNGTQDIKAEDLPE